ncbi:MAG: hypothetical protein JNJ60_21925, partial [Rhodocyclaceae bacterium]|nr:hypothetical protein [Rhodocyclaceae bacterium]
MLSARVAGSNPGGSVTFRDGTNVLGTATVTAGVATLSKTFD